jgi:hypothetical protein
MLSLYFGVESKWQSIVKKLENIDKFENVEKFERKQNNLSKKLLTGLD